MSTEQGPAPTDVPVPAPRRGDRRKDHERARRWGGVERRKGDRRSASRESPPEEVRISRPQRWDVPFGEDMTEARVERLLQVRPFDRMDPDGFPPSTPLKGILLNDARIVSVADGDIVVREGDYGNSAFFILKGRVRIVINPSLPNSVLGRREPQKKGLFASVAQLWRNPQLPEVRDISAYGRRPVGVGVEARERDSAHVFLQDVPGVLKRHKTAELFAGQAQEGDLFGELAALGRTPRTATVFAEGDGELLEIRWQGLRDLRRSSAALREHIDEMYRQRALAVQIRETPIFRHLDEATLKIVAEKTQFETFGNFDWYASYKSIAGAGPAERIGVEQIIVEENHYPNGVIIVRGGFARMSHRVGKGHRTVSYLGKGSAFGLREIVHNWRTGRQVPFQHSLRAIGYVDVLMVPTSVLEKYVLATLPPEQLPEPIEERSESDIAAERKPGSVSTDVLETLVDSRFINGTRTMVIDMDRCTRCDDCVRACAGAHDSNPRFIRHGPRFGKYMVANACMHCIDPVCMIGCPTGAIHRESATGQVVINDVTCIGCATCANSCPYHNIRMVEIRNQAGEFVLDESTHLPILKATKCDLCVDQLGGPACQRACPHDALRRLDLSEHSSMAPWVAR